MTPHDYIQAFASPRRRAAERKRLAKVAGVTYKAVRNYTELEKLDDGTTRPRRRPQDAELCQRLEKATNHMVTVADWNPAFAPLVKP